tara:strand:+ start:44 stop:298 length:255 start_codon:yes stop_codon:yes gene_type:complete
MANFNDVNTIIVAAGSANLSAHTYTQIYGGSAGCTMNLNGITLSVGASSSVNIVVNSISGGTGCFLLGERVNVFNGSTGIGGIN